MTLAYAVIIVVSIVLTKKWGRVASSSMWFFPLLLAAMVLGGLALLLVVDINSIQVDRWYMIETVWQNIKNGRYPYLPSGHSPTGLYHADRFHGSGIPGPFPFYFALTIPFHLAGLLGMLPVISAVIPLAFLYQNHDKKAATIAAILLCMSPAFWWEVAARSTLFFNGVLVVVALRLVDRISTRRSPVSYMVHGAISGLALSTRSVVFLPLCIYLTAKYLRNRQVTGFTLSIAAMGLVFGMTVVPLYIWDYQLFFTYNPLLLQGSMLPKPFILLLTGASVYFGYRSSTPMHTLGNSGILLFTSVAIYALIVWTRNPESHLITGDYIDISYFILAMPFLLSVLSDAKAFKEPFATPQEKRWSDLLAR